jgi:hypothetical protein
MDVWTQLVLKAEALASLHVVKFCQELGISCIVLEGDAIDCLRDKFF